MALFREMRDRFEDVLSVEAAVTSNPDMARDRRQTIAAMPFGSQAVTSAAAHFVVTRAPQVVKHLLDRPYTSAGYHVVGRGTESTVLTQDGQSVLKVMRYPRGLSLDMQERYMEDLSQKQADLQEKIGDTMVPLSFALATDPRTHGQRTILATQRLVSPYEPLNVHRHADIAALSEQQRTALIDFVGGSFALHREQAHVPDVIGHGNLGFEGDQLRLIDPVPVSKYEFGQVYESNIGTLQRLGEMARLG